MSRIDEALRQSSLGSPATAPARVGNPAAATPEEVLAQYPQELSRRPAKSGLAINRRPDPSAPSTSALASAEPARVAIPAEESLASKLIVSPLASHVYVEQYRRLAAAMHELQSERGVKTLLITSALPREGKTLTVTNLALTLSESYQRRVLLIDADLRRPSVHKLLELSNVKGLNDALRSDRTALPMQQVSPHLSVVPAGRADNNPMAGLTSERMRHLLEKAAADFDWVLIDTPPVAILPDAGILAGLAHAILLVVAAGATPHHMVERAMTELGRDLIVGAVMNRIEGHRVPATDSYADYYSASRAED